ncbi:PatB family C-S lyase [Ruminococcus sp. CLA-AA-H200]|uniref:cysteine-S-conjugate beta-lyase n=1 Tax=Ruminococcus turbiniformis TaxID=2881258 RepID=A0ABS8G1Z5_9FIRM|nr:PatB family C-S lyase [Ruminococcus turbiniformis]MCC2256298.1 PatB family C-S lyase [Ruminococcus turbiniformis]
MKYNFGHTIRRIGTSCSKWDSEKSYQTGEVIPMWVADMDFPVAEPIMRSLKKRLEHPVMGYVWRDPEFAELTTRWMKLRHGWETDTDWVTFCPGIVPAISASIQAYTAPGEAVMIQSPVYYPFRNTIISCSRKVVDNPLKLSEGHYTMDLDDMRRKIKENDVRLLIFCNPHNPVGRVYTRGELEEMAQICLENNVLIFSDEIHSDLVYKGQKHIPIASLSSDISNITATGISPSKTFNLAGLQTSSVICENTEMRKAFEKVINMNSLQFCNVFGLEAYKAAYREGEEYLEQLLEYLEANIRFCQKYFEHYLQPLEFKHPQGTYLLWIDCRKLGLSAKQLEEFMLKKARLSLDSGYWFGQDGEGFMRMNIACPRMILEQALEQLKDALKTI